MRRLSHDLSSSYDSLSSDPLEGMFTALGWALTAIRAVCASCAALSKSSRVIPPLNVPPANSPSQ
jgi:hypothetical protein